LGYQFGNTVMQSHFARGPQLHVRVISVISELYFVASGSVLSCVIYSFDHGSVKEASENFAQPIENNTGSRE
jgi:hypothetical protein